MAIFEIHFSVVDHFNDDAGYGGFVEATRVTAENEKEALNEFHTSMFDTTYSILDLFEVK